MTIRRTTRWNITLVAAVLTSATGVLLQEPTLLVLSVPGIVFAAYSHATAVPTPTLALDRSIPETDLSHGQAVEVTVTLRNTGERLLPSVCLVDRVPPMLSVQEGTPRHATALGPGDETTFSYTVTAKHGVHRFGPAAVVLEDMSASVTVETTVPEPTELACRCPVQTTSAGQLLQRHAGQTTTTAGDSGTEFSTVRSYRPGDPPSRIDWNRYARDGELTTVNFNDDRSRTIVLCLDARAACYRSAGDDTPHAVFYERIAARELLAAVADLGEPIGLAVFGTESAWIAPNTGCTHVRTIERTLDDPDSLPLEPPERGSDSDSEFVQTLQTWLDRHTSVVFFSPLLDDVPLEAARTLRAEGHAVTVLSPDVTTPRSLGTEIAGIQRDNRIEMLRRATVSVVDWDPTTPLETEIQREVSR